MALDGTSPEILERKNRQKRCFWDSVNKTDSCWNWTAASCGIGYGMFMLDRIKYKTHRLSYEAYHGEIPGGMHVLHRCDNPRCVNPDHLFLGNHYDNMHDAILKKRTKIGLKGYFSGAYTGHKGEKNKKAKLSELDVKNIRKSDIPTPKIAKIYCVSRQTIWSVRRGKTWH